MLLGGKSPMSSSRLRKWLLTLSKSGLNDIETLIVLCLQVSERAKFGILRGRFWVILTLETWSGRFSCVIFDIETWRAILPRCFQIRTITTSRLVKQAHEAPRWREPTYAIVGSDIRMRHGVSPLFSPAIWHWQVKWHWIVKRLFQVYQCYLDLKPGWQKSHGHAWANVLRSLKVSRRRSGAKTPGRGALNVSQVSVSPMSFSG